MKLHEWIKKVIGDTPGLTQKGLAASMSMNPATVNRMLYGRRHIRAEEVPLIEKYLGRQYSVDVHGAHEYTQETEHEKRGAFSDGQPIAHFVRPADHADTIPVYKIENNKTDAVFKMVNPQAVDWVARHPFQRGSEDAYALYVTSIAFEPRYYSGELVYIHAGRPPAIAQDCLLKQNDGTFHLCRYMGQDQENVVLENLQTRETFRVPHQDTDILSAVVGRG